MCISAGRDTRGSLASSLGSLKVSDFLRGAQILLDFAVGNVLVSGHYRNGGRGVGPFGRLQHTGWEERRGAGRAFPLGQITGTIPRLLSLCLPPLLLLVGLHFRWSISKGHADQHVAVLEKVADVFHHGPLIELQHLQPGQLAGHPEQHGQELLQARGSRVGQIHICQLTKLGKRTCQSARGPQRLPRQEGGCSDDRQGVPPRHEPRLICQLHQLQGSRQHLVFVLHILGWHGWGSLEQFEAGRTRRKVKGMTDVLPGREGQSTQGGWGSCSVLETVKVTEERGTEKEGRETCQVKGANVAEHLPRAQFQCPHLLHGMCTITQNVYHYIESVPLHRKCTIIQKVYHYMICICSGYDQVSTITVWGWLVCFFFNIGSHHEVI